MARLSLPFLLLLACTPAGNPSGAAPVYDISVTERGFEPVRIEVPANREIVLRFTRKVAESCADAVLVQGDPVKHMLPKDKPVEVRVAAPKSGEVRFACPMDMYRGAVVVTGG
jgi:plastocyanin domain-containing protein